MAVTAHITPAFHAYLEQRMLEPLFVFADGGVMKMNPSPFGGMWAWCHVNWRDQRVLWNAGVVFPEDVGLEVITNNLTEFMALTLALEALPAGWEGVVCSDSQLTLRRFFEGVGMRGIPHSWAIRGSRARLRLGDRIEGVLIKGHPTRAWLAAGHHPDGRPVSEHNVFVDAECTRVGAEYWATRP